MEVEDAWLEDARGPAVREVWSSRQTDSATSLHRSP